MGGFNEKTIDYKTIALKKWTYIKYIKLKNQFIMAIPLEIGLMSLPHVKLNLSPLLFSYYSTFDIIIIVIKIIKIIMIKVIFMLILIMIIIKILIMSNTSFDLYSS
jgi:hypothetical protein